MLSQDFMCNDCDSDSPSVSRRGFIRTGAAGVAGAAVVGGILPRLLEGTQASSTSSETLAARLYETLTDEQKKVVTFSFDDPLRRKVEANWRITKSRVGELFDKDQQQLIHDIFMGLHSPEYVEQVFRQVQHDTKGEGLEQCSVALFGQPGSGKFEFVLSGRHVTRRCDGDSVKGAAFGGPIFYGHAAQGFRETSDHPGNAYWFQAQRANALYEALDGPQQRQALRDDPRKEQGTKTVQLAKKESELKGIPFAELSRDQKELAMKVMADLLAPFRRQDADESMKLITQAGIDKLHMSYYKNLDIGDDGVWDVWQIEGPTMVWYFRGSPHVHTWVNITG